MVRRIRQSPWHRDVIDKYVNLTRDITAEDNALAIAKNVADSIAFDLSLSALFYQDVQDYCEKHGIKN